MSRPDSPGLYILNPSARLAWHLFRSGKPSREATAEFAAKYEIPADIADRDLRVIRRQWEDTLLSPVSAPGASSVPPPPTDLSAAFSRYYRLNGKNIRVILRHPDLVSEIAPRLEPLLADVQSNPDVTLQASASESGYHIFRGPTCIATEDHPTGARIVLLQEFVRSTQSSDEWVAILHAGACGTKDCCILFSGASQSGKTTLTAALMHAGFVFYTDDSAPLEAESYTVPRMPFSLMIREGSWPVLLPRLPELAESPIQVRWGQNVRFVAPRNPNHTTPAKVSAIVFSRFQPGAGTGIERLDTLETLVRLKESGFWVKHSKESIARFLDWLESLPCYTLTYSDLDEAIATVRTLLGG